MVSDVRPQVDGGRYPAKATRGDWVAVECDAYVDGADALACDLLYAGSGQADWTTVPMRPLVNDRWAAEFAVPELGYYRFAVRAALDRFGTWRRDLHLRAEADQDLALELRAGVDLLAAGAGRLPDGDCQTLRRAAEALGQVAEDAREGGATLASPLRVALGEARTVGELVDAPWLIGLAAASRDVSAAAESEALIVVVEPERARFSTWYELFPRSASPDPGRAGTLDDVRDRLDYLVRLGVDVLYLPPIHPIGATNRKGRDGAVQAAAGEPGSPWAIGSGAGGHTAVDPELGGLDALHRLVAAAGAAGIEVALDLAFQVSPDHPWVREHPEWFRRRPDGSIRHAENPPKRYEDIYPLDFETPTWRALWTELLDVVLFWIEQGVRTFRVDNPHTKPFRFWQWLIGSVKAQHPDTVFLSEAFTRPRVMEHLAKVGFSQSYTYFAWRTTKWDLQTYLGELTRTDVAAYLRPNLWPATPDILAEPLQSGGRPAFITRLVLAATLGASYGIYGPAFELQEHVPRSSGSEEYHDSEKYAIRHWDLDRPDSLAPLMARLNEVRRSHPALQRNDTLRFHGVDNDQIIAYSKTAPVTGEGAEGRADGVAARVAGSPGASRLDAIVTVVNLDPFHAQSGWVELDLGAIGLAGAGAYMVHDLLTDARYRWEGQRNFVLLDPAGVPAHVLAVEGPAPGGAERETR
ncbi:MAG TPA: alpha-1,4-glucan--maltose-1-phosphate maltosyltransferase [Acidimicrobiales bacterium]